MINNRSELLAAVRVGQPGADGLRVGPVVYVSAEGDRDIVFGAVRDEDSRAKLIDRIKRASSASFAAGVQWELPHVRKKSDSKTGVAARNEKSIKRPRPAKRR